MGSRKETVNASGSERHAVKYSMLKCQQQIIFFFLMHLESQDQKQD